MPMIADNHQVVLQIESDAVRIGQLGRIAFEHPERRVIIGRSFPVDGYGGGVLHRHIEFLPRFIGCDAPGPMRCRQEPVGSNVSFGIPREDRHPILCVVIGDVDVKRLRIDIRPAQHLHARLVPANDSFRLREARFGRRVVQPRVLHNAKQILVGHHHHVVVGVHGDGAPGRVRIFDIAQRLLVDIARPRMDLDC